ncbi:MAG: lytic transglycosylase domain-containing protein [Spirochaetales bacterium]|nr:lytic transglycosylase domain-containing protein [Spirochaetales bacterium]
MKINKLRPVYFLPLFLVLVLYGCYSVRSYRKTENLDRMFSILLSPETLEPADWILLKSYSRNELLDYMETWSPGRRNAAFKILELNGLEYPDRTEAASGINRSPGSRKESSEGLILQQAEEFYLLRDYEASEKAYREYWFNQVHNSETLPPPVLLGNIRNTVVRSSEASTWISILNDWKGFSRSGFGGSFFLASCYETASRPEEAVYWYEQSAIRSGNLEEIRRAQWYVIRLLSRERPDRLPAFLYGSGRLRNEGAYFDDVIDEYYSTLVRSRRWKELQELVPALEAAGLKEAAVQGQFLLTKAVESGYARRDEHSYAYSMDEADPRGYIALRTFPDQWPLREQNPGSADSYPSDNDEFYRVLMSAGYEKEALGLLQENRETVSAETVAEFARFMESEGDLYELIRFAGYWFYRLPPEEGMKLLPWVFPGAGRYAVADEIVPEELILGVIRRESAFHEGISSRVGAGGLMQLMPATADDLARRHRMEDWDLMNPEDNITLGTLYLHWLIDRPWTDSYVDVLAAYNGGGGNLRTWKRRFGSSDPDLFIQSIPFRETRDYVRKVIVAAASYRYLDTGLPPGEWLDQFYQSF